MEIADLKKIGLTNGEIRIYEALLTHGETTRTKLAKNSGISPSKIYDVANRLLGKGIVSTVKKNNILHFSAANPERLKDFIEQKEQELSEEKQLVEKLMPALLSKYQERAEQIDVEVFNGWEGLKTAFSDMANAMTKDDVGYVFGAGVGKLDSRQANVFFQQHFQKVKEREYKVKIIFNENFREKGDHHDVSYYKNNPPHEVRFLHRDTFTEVDLYNETVLFVMLLTHPIVIRVTNAEVAASYKSFFDTMWEQATP